MNTIAPAALNTPDDTKTNTNRTTGTLGQSKDQFLKLLMAQLKYQDPLQPPDANKFGEQMTQFGQLEQLFNLNDSMAEINNNQKLSDQLRSMDLIGRTVTAKVGDKEISGKVRGVSFSEDGPLIQVGDDEFSIGLLTSIQETQES